MHKLLNFRSLKPQLRGAIRQVQRNIRWKPGKDESHLKKRIALGHLPSGTMLTEYEAIIRTILLHSEAVGYVFRFNETYYTGRCSIIQRPGVDGNVWFEWCHGNRISTGATRCLFPRPKVSFDRANTGNHIMNHFLENYVIDAQYPDVSGIEHLQMLETRSKLAEIEAELSPQERKALLEADRKLAVQADKFLQELSRFVVLADERRQRRPNPNEWWWYLDILAQVPVGGQRPFSTNAVAA